jgi:hypothetical protein
VNRAASILSLLPALGFGIPCVFAIRFFADNGYVWTFMGFPTYGEGPFEDWGIETTVRLLVTFLLVCVAELVLALLLWRGRRTGAVLSLALLPVEFLFWVGLRFPSATSSGSGEPRWPSQAGEPAEANRSREEMAPMPRRPAHVLRFKLDPKRHANIRCRRHRPTDARRPRRRRIRHARFAQAEADVCAPTRRAFAPRPSGSLRGSGG